MLILQRKKDEAIRIGQDIRIVVLHSEGGRTRLGIEAPDHVTILREEILDQVGAENLLASQRALEVEGLKVPRPTLK
jgi:carbon storage regulator